MLVGELINPLYYNTFLSLYDSITVGGLGFGLIAGIVAYANVIEAASGPGIIGIRGSDDSEYFLLTSGNILFIIIIDITNNELTRAWVEGYSNFLVCLCVCLSVPR